MKKSYLVAAFAIFVLLSMGVSKMNAQTVEGDPTTGLVFTPIFEENKGTSTAVPNQMPMELRTATSPDLAVAPNPVVDELLTVWYNELVGTSRVEVLDLKGQVQAVAQVGSDRERNGQVTFPVQTMVPGVYFVRLTSGMYSSVVKILVR